MLDLAIILALVVVNALVQSAYVRWRRNGGKRGATKHAAASRGITYPSHPSPGFTCVPEHAAGIRPAGIDW